MTNKRIIKMFLKSYGKNLRDKRLEKGLTQIKLAKLVGCSQAIISHIENGYMLPPPHIENPLLEILDKKECEKDE